MNLVIHQNVDSQLLWLSLINFTYNMSFTLRKCSWSCACPAVHGRRTQPLLVGAHSYADDSQLYHHAPVDLCVASVSVVVSCIGELDRWMCSNQLKLNTDKTNFNYRDTPEVLIDRELPFSAHIKRLTGRCFYQLRKHCPLRPIS